MSLKYAYRKARKIIDGLPPEGRKRVKAVGEEIREAENGLLRSGADLTARCVRGCQGLCCRNIQEESLIHLWDFVYILTVKPEMGDRIAAHLVNEDSLFPSDCIFLQDGVGPCIFPPDVRPERCLTAFCFDVAPIGKEIRRVKIAFHKLAWTVQSVRLKAVFHSAAARIRRAR